MPSNKRKVNGEKGSNAKTVEFDFGPIPPGQSNFSEDNSINHLVRCLPTLARGFSCRMGDVKSLDLTQIVPSNSVAKRTDSSIMKMFKGCGPCLRQLKIGLHHDKSTLLLFISEYCSQLRKLEIEFMYNDQLCPKRWKNEGNFMVSFFMSLPHEILTEVHLSAYPRGRFLTSFTPRAAMTVFNKRTNLAALTLNNYILSSDIFESINEHLNLQSLCLRSCKTTRVLLNLDSLVNLEHLNLSNIQTVTSDVIIRVSEQCKNLKHLDLSEYQEVTDRGISALVNLPQLEVLIVSCIKKITDEPLSRMHNLRRLDCSGCHSVLHYGITTLLKFTQNLEYLDITYSGVPPNLSRAASFILRQRMNGVTLKIQS